MIEENKLHKIRNSETLPLELLSLIDFISQIRENNKFPRICLLLALTRQDKVSSHPDDNGNT